MDANRREWLNCIAEQVIGELPVRMAMVEDSRVRHYQPTFVIDQHGVMRYTDAPVLADASGRISAPVIVSTLASLGSVSLATPGL